MRIALRIGLALLALVVAAFIALAVWLPSWVEGAGFRETFQQLAKERLGRTIDYGAVSVHLLPPRVDVADFVLGGATPKAEPSVRARSASLVLGWRALLRGRAVVDAIVIEGAELRLVRTQEGIDLLAAAVPAAPAAGAGGGAPAVQLDRASLRDSRVVFDDRVAKPPVVWTLADVSLDVSASSLAGPFAFDLAARLESGGDVEASGEIDPEGPVDAKLALTGFEAGPLRSYAEALGALSGRVDARADVRRTSPEAPLGVDAQASSSSLVLATGDLRAKGGVAALVKLE